MYRVTNEPFVWQVSCLRWINMPQIWPRTTSTDPKYLQKRSYLKCLSPLPRKILWIYMNNITNNHLKGQKLLTVSYRLQLTAYIWPSDISSFWLKILRVAEYWFFINAEGSIIFQILILNKTYDLTTFWLHVFYLSKVHRFLTSSILEGLRFTI